MNLNPTGQTSMYFLMIAAMLFGSSIANAQSKKMRPPVAGDGKYFALPDNTVVPQNFYVERPTLNNAGFEWHVSGDENHNAKVTVRFREVGTSGWREGLPLLRIQREKIWGHEQRDVYETPNMFAGSLFGLEPATTYECEFTMTDPDGLIGVAKNIEKITTRAVPQPYEHGKVYHVYPLGYEGSREEPAFTGLNEAYYGYNGSGDWWLYSEPRVKPVTQFWFTRACTKANVTSTPIRWDSIFTELMCSPKTVLRSDPSPSRRRAMARSSLTERATIAYSM